MDARIIWTCKKCKFDNPMGSQNCNNCGCKLKTLDFGNDNVVARWVCPQCGGKNMFDNDTCFNCGFARSKSNCFLTTTVCSVLRYEDNCYALENLRKFRKDYLEPNKDGQDLLIEYKQISDIVVPKILSDKNKESVCEYVYKNFILPVNKLVDSQKHKEAVEKYREMVNYFETKYNEK